jgi:DNA (cytosine-5)-methyltransferase 1
MPPFQTSIDSLAPINRDRTFIDLYAGCGGLSVGLMMAGWHGLFAIEKEPNAFASLSHNLINGNNATFDWPRWLPTKPISLEQLLSKYRSQLESLTTTVDLLAGGPPCQGFSTLGDRIHNDPRNQAFLSYLKVVKLIKPRLVLIENVRGITLPFGGSSRKGRGRQSAKSYSDRIITLLGKANYDVWAKTIVCTDFGIPQIRPRFILIAKRRDQLGVDDEDPFNLLDQQKSEFLKTRKLHPPICAKQAIGDLEVEKTTSLACIEYPRFRQGNYGFPKSNYQKLMHGKLNGELADSHRFANHRAKTVKKFQWFLTNCSKGEIIGPEKRGRHKNNKHTVYVLSPTAPAPTVTTLPDDILHYSEPRILTVREMARLQSFPDWFEFKGKYTTGGPKRVQECPRYTQVGNAVPPLLAEAIGRALLAF